MVVEAETEVAPIPTNRNVPRLSTSESVVVLGRTKDPSPLEIQKAIETLVHLKSQADFEVAVDVKDGDIFFLYDLSLRVRGEQPYRIKSQLTLHGALTEDGLPDAAAAVASAIESVIRPLKGKANAWINDAIQEGVPSPLRQIGAKYPTLDRS